MINTPEHIAGVTTHTRRGTIRHKFSYGVDFVLIDPESTAATPKLFSRNRFNLMSLHDVDHGGPLRAGRGSIWAREILSDHGLSGQHVQLRLLAQPRFLGYGFNPVSFWLAMRGTELIAVIAEVSTPFGDRHSYLCHHHNFAPITAETPITKTKMLHVSPFQDVAGQYTFHFDIRADQFAVQIHFSDEAEGVVATLSGARHPMTNSRLMRASIRRPLGAMRTTILIHWQAVQLKLKGAIYRSRPTPPNSEAS
ncbi:MAG: DUF1365 family protein [Gammaproteobacteria bacterium]|jgi:DUF1365 family protein